MSELRQNPVTGRWVVVAPTRSERPQKHGEGEEPDLPEAVADPGAPPARRRDPGCPFCPGNEDQLPEVVEEVAGAEDPGWLCRAVPNRYPAFSEAPGDDSVPRLLREAPDGGDTPGRRAPAAGHQEVLIESPRHEREPTTMSAAELEGVVELYRRRIGVVTSDHPDLFPSLFRNRGPDGGASLAHPHSQLMATRSSGPTRRIREERLRRYHADEGTCLLCSLPDVEPGGRRRIVEDDAFHSVYVPWAPERPLEAWILPRRHRASLAGIEDDEAASFARVLGRTLRRIRILADAPDYNYVVHTSAGRESDHPGLHWFVRILPVTTRTAGFELDAGVVVNPDAPDDSARRLKSVPDERLRSRGGE